MVFIYKGLLARTRLREDQQEKGRKRRRDLDATQFENGQQVYITCCFDLQLVSPLCSFRFRRRRLHLCSCYKNKTQDARRRT